MMSQRKVDLQGNVPFSWEDMPGVSKHFIPQKCHSDHTDHHPQITLLPCSKSTSDDAKMISHHDHSLPLPPPINSYGPRPNRSFSRRILWREHYEEETDPFLAALVECTKSVTEEDKSCDSYNYKKSFFRFGFAGSSSAKGVRTISRSFSLFSCKLRPFHDVVENNVVKVTSRSPPIVVNPRPRGRFEGLIHMQEKLKR